MKTLTPHSGINRYALGLLVLGMVLIFAFTDYIPLAFQGHVILLFLAVVLIVTPWSSRRIPLENAAAKRKPFLHAFGLTLAAECTLLLLFYTISHLAGVTLLIEIPHTNPTLFPDSLRLASFTWGLFPWGSYVLLAAGIAYACYIKQQAGDMSTVLQPVLKNTQADLTSLAIDVITKLAILFALGSTLALVTEEVVGLIAQQAGWHFISGPRLDLLIVVMLLMHLCRGTFAERPLRWLGRHHVAPALVIVAFLVIMALVMLLVGTLLPWVSPQLSANFTTTLALGSNNIDVLWQIFMGMWWCSWAPLFAGLLACIWRGYRIRTLLLTPLLLPLLIAGGLAIAPPHWHLALSNNTSLLNLIPAIVGLIGMLLFFLQLRYLIYAWKAKLSVTHLVFKGNPASFLTRVIQSILLLGGCFWVGGVQITALLYFFLNYIIVIFIFTAAVAVCKALVFNRP